MAEEAVAFAVAVAARAVGYALLRVSLVFWWGVSEVLSEENRIMETYFSLIATADLGAAWLRASDRFVSYHDFSNHL